MTEAADKTIVDALGADDSTGVASGPPVLARRYELLGLLGSGGMGTVYRARDRELDEIVALKVLKSELAQSRDMLERFRREVKLARKVTHVNVARTFDIGEHEGDRFLTMELVDGAPLSALAKTRLPLVRVLEIASDVLDALAISHDAGVVHGDLKPENVICANDGRTVITDFGIARALHADPDGVHTATGMLVGTPQYMAPEQVEGARDLDGRIDLYALGCMVYRLVTGEPAWSGTSYVTVAAARLLRGPPDPSERLPSLSADVRNFIMRCMARERADRFPDARAAKAALAAAIASATTSTRAAPAATALTAIPTLTTRSVAVLPVQNLGADDDAYLAAGFTDDLIDVLSTVPHVRVRPRGSVATFTQPTRDAREIGRKLGVDAVVDGTLRRAGENIRATLRLVTVADGFQLWAKRFDRPASEFFALGDAAAEDVATALASEKITPSREAKADAAALDLYLRGRFIYTRSFFDAAEAVALLRAAHERAPDDGRISAQYALAMMRHQHIALLPKGTLDSARALATRVIEDDPSIGEAHVALALVHLARGDHSATAASLVRALEVSPNNVDALSWMGSLLLECDRIDAGLATLEAALAEDPELRLVYGYVARAHALRGEWDACDRAIARILRGEGDGDVAYYWMVRGRLAAWRGDRQVADRLSTDMEGAPIAEPLKDRIRAMLRVTRDGKLDDHARELVHTELGNVSVPRRAAFNAQIRIELYARGGLLDAARADYAALEAASFVDIAWLDRCPLLGDLRSTPEHVALRASVATRVAGVLDVIESSSSGFRQRALGRTG